HHHGFPAVIVNETTAIHALLTCRCSSTVGPSVSPTSNSCRTSASPAAIGSQTARGTGCGAHGSPTSSGRWGQAAYRHSVSPAQPVPQAEPWSAVLSHPSPYDRPAWVEATARALTS